MPFSLSFQVDPQTHFPLVEVPAQDFALFWLPITKVQTEYFLSETRHSQFDRAWYRERLSTNQRIIPELLIAQNLLQAFLSGISFYEARVISRWYGASFDLPTAEEWCLALRTFDRMAAQRDIVDQILALPDLHPRAQLLVRACDNAMPGYQRLRDTSDRRLSHQLFLRAGMLEYVYQDATRNSCGMCDLSPGSGRSGNADQDAFRLLRDAHVGNRMPDLGLRPILRKRL